MARAPGTTTSAVTGSLPSLVRSTAAMPAPVLKTNLSPFAVYAFGWKYRLDPPPSPDSRMTRCPVAGSIQSDGGSWARAAGPAGMRASIRVGRTVRRFMGFGFREGGDRVCSNSKCPHGRLTVRQARRPVRPETLEHAFPDHHRHAQSEPRS